MRYILVVEGRARRSFLFCARGSQARTSSRNSLPSGSIRVTDPGVSGESPARLAPRAASRPISASAGDVLATLRELADADSIVVQDAKQVAAAFGVAAAGAAFSDALISATCAAAGCTSVVSFDEHAVKTLGFRTP